MHQRLIAPTFVAVVGFAVSCAVASHAWASGSGAEILDPLGSSTSSSAADPVGQQFSLAVPAYHSYASATKKLYLDFDGDVTSNWNGYVPGTTPAYSIDSDTTSFSAQELSNINEICQRVAEMYSPFNIDVTTVAPDNNTTGNTLRIVIGGDGKNGASDYWVGQRAGGVCFINSFYNSNLPNWGYVFPGNLGNGFAKYVAVAAAHEAGHGFGLYHQSTYDANGAKTAEYNIGDAVRAPIMGNAYYSTRGLWWNGTSLSAQTYQLDESILQSLGYRPLDHGNSIQTATALPVSGTVASASGVIETTSDKAFYSFDISTVCDVSFTVTGAPYGAMLDPALMLFSGDGGLLQYVGDLDVLTETMTLTLNPGSYDIAVLSQGRTGDIGQYFLSGTITPVSVPEPSIAGILVFSCFLARRSPRR